MSQEQGQERKRDPNADAIAEYRANERRWNAEVIAEFRANRGEVAAPYPDPPPMLLLHTIGARSGQEHIVPMRSLPDGESLSVFASAHGSERNPDWRHSLVAHPDVTIEVGTETVNATATIVQDAAQAEIRGAVVEQIPHFAGYQDNPDREVPMIALESKPESGHPRSGVEPSG